MQVRLLDEAVPQPWRNGGGVTRELLAWPPGASDWQLRVSVAEITQNGPFSAFPGIARWFAVLQGAGVTLHFAQGDVAMTTQSAALNFDGADAPGCTLVDGPTQDLNLMLRDDAGEGGLLRAASGVTWHSSAPLRGLFSTGALHVQAGDEAPTVVHGAALMWSETSDALPWQISALAPGTRAWWLHFTPHSR